MRTLVSLVEQRRRLVNDRVRITNRLRNTLKQYYTQALEWFDRIDTLLFCDFIERWPTLLQVKRARRTTVQSFFYQHNMRSAGVLDARLRYGRDRSPEDAAADGKAGRVQAIPDMTVAHRGPHVTGDAESAGQHQRGQEDGDRHAAAERRRDGDDRGGHQARQRAKRNPHGASEPCRVDRTGIERLVAATVRRCWRYLIQFYGAPARARSSARAPARMPTIE